MQDIMKILKQIKPHAHFELSADFISDGLIDSLDLLTLVEVMEQTFHVSIKGEDLHPDNFRDLLALNKLIENSASRIAG